ncbi:unnamed protein product [Allacma fusca]|uniref:Defensin n=1 Tax=Allacma fusca TaxID=39272 RepID=A0A8J2JRU5_9HEXA|nr:unnamed protein product [Allacma fusca]
MHRKITFVLLLVACVALMAVEETSAADSWVSPCDNHCPNSPYYCLVCCQAHHYKGGAAACHGTRCMCRI